ncbi:hypothetical protein CDAR_433701 [Caerostris darwini]|uniref:Uncharacterized protein n=1 Tax=Caerostris darwini TaxID=1538125 RepID=A0AAV4PHV3_9ARAC|nr:hypothetical protein CDAR_433701 [Caerostris darwini]
MDENRSRIYQYLEQITEEIEKTIVLASDVFYYLQQAVYVYIVLDPEKLTTHECRVREQESTSLINRLQEFRKIIEQLMELYEFTVCEAKNCNHSTLLDRLEKDIKCKITELLDKVLYKEQQVDRYQIKLTVRQNETKFAKRE